MQRAGPLAMRWDAAFGEITITYRPPGLITYASKPKRVRSCSYSLHICVNGSETCCMLWQRRACKHHARLCG